MEIRKNNAQIDTRQPKKLERMSDEEDDAKN